MVLIRKIKSMGKKKDDNKQPGGITDKKDMNAGSGAFNQGSEQDPEYNKGTPVSDEEKKTGHLPSPLRKKKDVNKNNP
jgi:hypothetical protein